MRSKLKLATAAAILALGSTAHAADAPILLRSTPQTVIRGIIAADRAPVLRINSGDTVRIDTVSHGGLTEDPVAFFAEAGIPAEQVLQDVIDISKVPRSTEGFASGHVLTGPIYIEGAEPGDMLEIRVIAVDPRVPYGVNNPGPGGVAPTLVPERQTKVIKFDITTMTAAHSPGVTIPIRPFMGIMAVAPRPEIGRVGSRAPGEFGGNIDFRLLTAGSTLYLPVFNLGALFYTGDSHAAQGHGEVSGNAIEASMSTTMQFVLHKGQGKDMRFPWAEDAEYYYPMGLDPDLDTAYRFAVEDTVRFLQKTKGMTAADAYSLSSVALDFGVAQAVDGTLGAFGAIPKSLFAQKTAYWGDR
jgi:acetamidase/formamidase